MPPRPTAPPAAPSAAPPPSAAQGGVTELLRLAQGGDAEASDAFARAVYDELRTLAAGYLRRERADHTLQPTALVHEAFVRLLGQARVDWQSRAHFFGVAARVMRRLLVDHARRAQAAKRDGGARVVLEDAAGVPADAAGALDVLGVHGALEALAAVDPRQARLVELRFFVGLTIEEAAAVLGVSRATATREWAMARAWLAAELGPGGADDVGVAAGG